MKEDSTVEDLCNGPRSPFAKLCWLLSHEATKLGHRKDQVKLHLMNQLDRVYEKGANIHTAVTPDIGDLMTNKIWGKTFFQKANQSIQQLAHARQQKTTN